MTTSDYPAPLPVRLRPTPSETAESFVIRLAVVNHLPPSYLRRLITPGRRGMGAIDPGKLAAASIREIWEHLLDHHHAAVAYATVNAYVVELRGPTRRLPPDTLDPMIVWLNGTFGAGKTTTAAELTALLPRSRVFDTEEVGVMLRHVLASEPVRDFQDWQPWRGLVVATATQILDYLGGVLIIPQSVLVHQYWQEIRTGLTNAAIPICHIVLHADRDELIRRIETDPTMPSSQWRFDHLDDYDAARSWHNQEAHVIDTTGLTPHQVAKLVAAQADQARPATTDRHPAN